MKRRAAPVSAEVKEEQIEQQEAAEFEEEEEEEDVDEKEEEEEGDDDAEPELEPETKRSKKFDDERTVFVGRLSKTTSEADLRSLFSNSGTISRVNMPVHSDTGRPTGVAYVEFASVDSVPRACKLDGRRFMDAEIKVKPAALPAPQWQQWRKKTLAKADDACTVHVGNISYATDERTLIREFARCGNVVRVNIPLWHDTGRKRGFALLEFASRDAVQTAIRTMNGRTIDGREVTVGSYTPLDFRTIQQHRKLSRQRINPCHGLKGPASRRIQRRLTTAKDSSAAPGSSRNSDQ